MKKNKGGSLILVVGTISIIIVTVCAFNKDYIIHKYYEYTLNNKYLTQKTNEYYLEDNFNYVDNSFAKTSEYKWLLKNAENYGFILRYPEDKEDKTKIAYESWHWRYVGEENAKRMNELNMCLEEYVEYLQKGNK